MILLSKTSDKSAETIVLLVGRGLIGSAIEARLLRMGFVPLINLPIFWNDISSARNQIKSVLDFCIKNQKDNLNLIWAAGKAGFNTTETEALSELESFQNVLVLLKSYSQTIFLKVHLFSSAGGLFEGQVNVGNNSFPDPLRPYGFLKLKMENLLINFQNSFAHSIYRLSSVYGFIKESSRLGLISNLVFNALKKRETVIFGNYNTIRDYLWIEDATDFVVDEVIKNSNSNNIFSLVSCIPMSIFQIHKIVENTINRKCLIRFISNPTNIKHNTYNISIQPVNFNASLPFTNISKIYFDALKTNAFNSV
jgi:nucleoside-diphosphate-sugar epimerase